MTEWYLVLSLLVAGAGATLFFVGYILVLITVMGIHRVWGMVLLVAPLVGVALERFAPWGIHIWWIAISMAVSAAVIIGFAVRGAPARYPLRMIIIGLVVLAIAAPTTYHFMMGYHHLDMP